MAFAKHGRHGQRRISTPVIIFGSLFAAFLMIGVWAYTTPVPVEEAIGNTSATTQFVDKARVEVTTEDTHARTSSERESEEESKELEVEKRENDNDIDIEEKLEEPEVSDEREKREVDDAPELDESTILDKSMAEAKAEEAKAEEVKAAVAEAFSEEGVADVKQDAQPDDEPEQSKLNFTEKAEEAKAAVAEAFSEEGIADVKEDAQPDDEPEQSKLDVTETGEVVEEKTDPANAEDLPPVDTTELESNPDTEVVSTSSWKSQVSKSTDESEPETLPTEVAAAAGSEESESATQTEEEKRIEESQKAATTSIVIQEVPIIQVEKYKWKLCNWLGSEDYIPCLDNRQWLATHKQRKHYEHRERHCPTPAELPKCLVPLPPGYKQHIKWPESRSEAWYDNVPHAGLAQYKKDQNWVKKQGEKLIFPGGGTQFKHGAGHYIDWVQKIYPAIGWGKHTRVLLDVGCGVASFGGYLYDRDVLAMSFAPKDEHEAQVQLALERGIPAFSSVMGTLRLVFPSNSFDVVHCARCRVPWHVDGGMLLLELNRVLRPGGHFLWSATPVYQDLEEDIQIWKDTIAVIEAMGWTMKVKETDDETQVGIAIFQKPLSNEIYESRTVDKPEICPAENIADAAWNVRMVACIHKIPDTKRVEWPEEWPLRATAVPTWLDKKDTGLYGKPAPEDFAADTDHWDRVVSKTYMAGLGIDWSTIRNVMDMKAGYGGFAAALVSQKLWVLNIVPTSEPDTLPIIYDRGMIGMYHDWCEPHSTYPRSYDLLHADHLISAVKARNCSVVHLAMEMDRILRPDGWAIFRDERSNLAEVEEILDSLHWDLKLSFAKQNEVLLAVQKRFWRPDTTS